METYEVLEKALALIEDEKDWTQGDYKVGEALCAEGACLLAGGVSLEWDGQRHTINYETPTPDEYHRAFDVLYGLVPGTIHDFNDNHSHAEVVALFQEAIRAEKQQAGVPIDVPAPARETASV